MSKGEDFETGGFYFRDKNNKKINIEDNLEIGDAVIFYGSITHGVEKVDKHKKLIGKLTKEDGLLECLNDSDHVKNRITAKIDWR